MKNITSALLLSAAAFSASAREWTTDILGTPFEQTTIRLDSDYAGDPVCTVIRAVPAHDTRRALLYIHGYNDYFFQEQMAHQFLCHGYSFFAVDLRRYGRSMRPGDTPYDIRDINACSAEIDSTLNIIRDSGIDEIVMLGHSTGGLIAASYLSRHHPPTVKALILNSPFLDWNLDDTEKFIPLVSILGKILPSVKIPQSKSTAYAESLLRSAHGQWEYNTTWKRPVPLPVTAGWVRAIDTAQRDLRKIQYPIQIPVLLTMSEQSISGDQWTPEFNKADAVLDVNDIQRYGSTLSRDLKSLKFSGGLHDLALSSCPTRCMYYKNIFSWLDTVLPDK